jgi:hypothetical protein
MREEDDWPLRITKYWDEDEQQVVYSAVSQHAVGNARAFVYFSVKLTRRISS